MDYKEKYENALERAKMEMSKDGMNNDVIARHLAETIFPELKESEDERIRDEIVLYIGAKNDISLDTHNRWLSWLEKQGKPQDKGEISDGYHTFNELYYYRMLYNAAFFNMLPKEWVHKSKRHNDGEECFGGGWFIVMANLPTGQISNHYELKDWDLFQIPEKEVADRWDGHTPQEAADRLHKYLLKKQDKQKPIDKIESKFKIGDWVAIEEEIIGLCTPLHIVDTNDKQYRVEQVDGSSGTQNIDYLDRLYHLWTIEDAKDGDVLANKDGAIFINAGNTGEDRATLDCYCYLSVQNEFCIEEHKTGSWFYKDDTKLATKEQRELLFQKMKEAGYEWSSEHRKLIKRE